jgi:DNA polymerase
MRNKGHEFKAGRVTYYYDGVHLWYMLPSGRVLNYPFVKFDAEGNVTYAKAAWKPAAEAKEWPRARLWRGLACENITQAVANDLLRHSLRVLDEKKIDVIAHVHDEVVSECKAEDAETVSAVMHAVMCETPDWATGLPLAAEGEVMLRYGK